MPTRPSNLTELPLSIRKVSYLDILRILQFPVKTGDRRYIPTSRKKGRKISNESLASQYQAGG